MIGVKNGAKKAEAVMFVPGRFLNQLNGLKTIRLWHLLPRVRLRPLLYPELRKFQIAGLKNQISTSTVSPLTRTL
jgi:hypothetical protein